MTRRAIWFTMALIGGGVSWGQAVAAELEVAHMVFFQVNKDIPDSPRKLAAACSKYLDKHPGTVYFAVGLRAEDLTRDVNDLQFDVALHVVFKNKAAHDQYQTSPRHLTFIEENQQLWSNVRVFDSCVFKPSRVSKPESKMKVDQALLLPDEVSGFAGVIRGRVIQKRGNRLVILVHEVAEQWKHSKATNGKALVGKKVLVVGRRPERGHSSLISKFLAMLKVGDVAELDVANQHGDVLTVVELTEKQRERVRQ